MDWRKPSVCRADEPMCLEVAGWAGSVALRATHSPDDVTVVSRDEFAAHIAAVKAGEYDDLV